jgi:L,D-transpeptidase YcbB
MHRIAVFLCAVILSFSLISCENETEKVSLSLNERKNFNPAEYKASFREFVMEMDSAAFPMFNYADTLRQFYAGRNYEPLFIKSFEELDFIHSLLNILEHADEHGLNPARYNVEEIVNSFGKALNDSLNKYNHLSKTEILAADAVINYAYHLRYGVVNPKKVFLNSYFLPVADSTSRKILEPLEQDDIFSYLESIQPRHEKYVKLQSALKVFNKYKDQVWTPFQLTTKKIEPGYRDSSLIIIADRLITLGILDTAVTRINDFSHYDSVFVNAVKKFQGMHGLNDDGVIGKTTAERLNTTPAEYINKIKLSLERFRWIDYSDKPEYILVNIPDFNLYVMKDGEEQFESRVCTGRKRSIYYESRYEAFKKSKNWWTRPEDWETPVMYGEISYMVLNPTWTVPENIIREEIVAGMRGDSLYLQKKNFKVFKNGEQIAAAHVEMEEFQKSKIPYTIVQGPGYANALGKIKFMFNNPFGIYLHDTPTRSAFSLDNRAVSHGCVRVEKPLALSEFLLAHQSKWNIDYLKVEVGSRVDNKEVISEYWQKRTELREGSSYGQTTDVKLEKKVPLYIDYYTAWVDKEGKINFRSDVYGKDAKLLEAMREEGVVE